jgi:DNA (cytosine-5)-methyltransferase 1
MEGRGKSGKGANSDVRVADLFCGIGGFHLAFHNVGAKCVFASEWNEAGRKTYEHNFKDLCPELFRDLRFARDITKVDISSIPDFDIICAGFPCQPFSQAGYKKGFLDDRGNLFFHIADIISKKKPRAFFLENVRHLLRHDSGRTFSIIKSTLESLGYSFHSRIVKGTDFNVPQHRPRLFMVGFRDKTLSYEFPQPVPLTVTMSDVLGGKCNKKVGYTLRVGGRGSDISDRRNWDAYNVDGRVVRLSVDQGRRMMGLPSWFSFPVSDAQAFKQLGNSVAIPAVEAVAGSVIETLENEKRG